MKKNLRSLFVILSAIPLYNTAIAQSNKIDPTGNVGVGTTTPFKTLDVRTPANDYMSVGYQLNLGQFSGIHFGYLENNNLYRKSALVFERLDNSARGKIHLLNNGGVNANSASLSDSRLTIDYDGNVGIGTTTPLKALEVRTLEDDYMSVGSYLGTGKFSGIHFGYIGINNNKEYMYRKSALVFERLDAAARGKIHILNNGGQDSNSARLSDARLTIDYDGNVGIGTVDPTDKLSVKGNIRAQEIKVEGGIWPDYVFAKSYRLPGLQETEQFIQKNGHLPGIPSASEVKKNGVELGSMNAKLLEKIEELTLYMIELKKDNEQLKKRVVELESKNNK